MMLVDRLDAHDPSAPALADDAIQVTYGQLTDRARRVATHLRKAHGGGRYVVVRATPTVDFVATLLGVAYSGNTPIPIEPDLPPHRVDYIVAKSEAAAVMGPIAAGDLAGASPSDHRDPSVPAIVLFTSGTSGHPKGVVVSHANLRHSCEVISEYLDYYQHASAAVALPLFYSYALLSQVCCMLWVGGRARLFRDLRNPLKFEQMVRAEGLETFCGVPSTYHTLCVFHRMRQLSMPGVRVLCSAGAPMDRSLLREVRTIFPSAAFFNNYGMTEAAPRISWIRDDDPRFLEPTCGKPMRGLEVKIIDPETGATLPDGQVGVLAIRGPNITNGYLNDPDLTAQAFTPDGFIISGDMARLDDGYIYVSGRYDDIFNSGGEKIAPQEIEDVLNHHSAIERAAVAGLPDPARGKAPVAFLKLRRPVERHDLVEYLAQELTHVKIPQRFLEVKGFPMTSNGKLQRRLLAIDDPQFVLREIE